MSSYFFRVEHDLLRSEAFKTLGGSAIKVYLVIGLYSDFGTDWAYPSIRTIAREAGLSRQTVLAGIEQLTRMGLLATSKSKGRSTAYRIIRQAPERPSTKSKSPAAGQRAEKTRSTGPSILEVPPGTVPESLVVAPWSGPDPGPAEAQPFGPPGPASRPEQEPASKEDQTTSIPIPGTPFRLTAEGRLLVAVDLQELLTNQGIPGQLAQRLLTQKDPEAVAKVLLNAFYLKSQGKLQNGPGYIRAGIEDGYDLLPQVANRLENRRRELEAQLRQVATRQRQARELDEQAAEEAAVAYMIEQLSPEQLDRLVQQAIDQLPEPLVRRNPTLSNPFVRSKVYELACFS
jgi:AcrR family transcriptional regulator